MESKKVVYIAGPITGVENYREAFNLAASDLEALGYIVLNPSVLPAGMTNAQYMRICISMLDCADAVLLLPGWSYSPGATLEDDYAQYKGLPRLAYRDTHPLGKEPMSEVERRVWLNIGLTEAFERGPSKEVIL